MAPALRVHIAKFGSHLPNVQHALKQLPMHGVDLPLARLYRYKEEL